MIEELKEGGAWLRLSRAIQNGEPVEDFKCAEQPLELFRKTMEANPEFLLSPKDRLVRLRQALRYGSLELGRNGLPFSQRDGCFRNEVISR